VGNDYAGDRRSGEHIGNRRFIFLIEIGGAVVQKNCIGVAVERTREQYPLTLAGRQRISNVSDQA